MKNVIGIRRESVDATDRRAPLTPQQAQRLVRGQDIKVIVQPSRLRVFPDEDYEAAGAVISSDLSGCNVSFGLEGIPIEHISPGQVYCFFSRTVKAQRYNMPMLKHIIESRCTLLDYELVTNDSGKRLIFLGDFAGYAGMIDAFWALGRRLEIENIVNPFTSIKQAVHYDGLEAAKEAVRRLGHQIRAEGLPEEIAPVVCAFTGRGNASKGAQQIFNLLPAVELRPDDLPTLASSRSYSRNAVYRVEFRKQHLYEPFDSDAAFDPETFDARPGSYREKFHRYAPFVTVLVNAIQWSPRYPRLLTREHMGELYASGEGRRLKVIADIACDIEGSIEFTVRHTNADNPVYVFEPLSSRDVTGFEGQGPVMLTVDKLPAELPREASESFGGALFGFIPALARADFSVPFEALSLPQPLRKAVIAHGGFLTEHFRYLNEYLLHG
jgi:saccharopine dehydrogenase (NAD+, L-lysine-forming)